MRLRGGLDAYERTSQPAAQRAENYTFLRDTDGATVAHAAMRMGISEGALRIALKRAGVKP